MIDIDVRDDRSSERQGKVGRVALVGLHHQHVTIAPSRIGAWERGLPTNHIGGVFTARDQDRRQHRGRRRLAVGARHPDRRTFATRHGQSVSS